MRILLTSSLAITIVLFSNVSIASSTMDKGYQLKTAVPLLIFPDTDTIYGEHVEREMTNFLEEKTRFEFMKDNLPQIKKDLLSRKASLQSLELIEPLKPVLNDASLRGVQLVFLGQMTSDEGNYSLQFRLFATDGAELLHYSSKSIGQPQKLTDLSEATREAMEELTKGIPFDATVIQRDGYRVVFDIGTPALYVGKECPVYTIENRSGHLFMEETGRVVVTEVAEHLSFGKILVDRKPHEVAKWNKLRLHDDSYYVTTRINPPLPHYEYSNLIDSNIPEPQDRKIASEETKPTLGFFNIQLGASAVTLNQKTVQGSGASQNQLYYPGGSLLGEIWLSTRFFFQFGYDFFLSTLQTSGGRLNSSLNNFKGQVGYRFTLPGEAPLPSLHVKIGLSRHQLQIDNSIDPLGFMTTSYSGIRLGGGLHIPLDNKWGLGLDVNTLLFASVSETPLTSGSETEGTSGIEFDFKGYYHLTEVIDLELKLAFQSYSADFKGLGTRGTAFASSSQTSRAIYGGLAYYF